MLKIWENTMLIVKNADEINAIEGIELRQLLTSRRKQLNSDLYLMENHVCKVTTFKPQRSANSFSV
jgi:hypothetical protein